MVGHQGHQGHRGEVSTTNPKPPGSPSTAPPLIRPAFLLLDLVSATHLTALLRHDGLRGWVAPWASRDMKPQQVKNDNHLLQNDI